MIHSIGTAFVATTVERYLLGELQATMPTKLLSTSPAVAICSGYEPGHERGEVFRLTLVKRWDVCAVLPTKICPVTDGLMSVLALRCEFVTV